MRVLRNLSWPWRVPACCLALAYALTAFECGLGMLPLGRHVNDVLFFAVIYSLIGFSLIWAATICAYVETDRLRQCYSSHDECWQYLRGVLYPLVGIAGIVVCFAAFVLQDDPAGTVETSFIAMTSLAVGTILLYAPVMSKLLRCKHRRLAREAGECYYCGLDLADLPEHREEQCEGRTRAGRRRRRRERAGQRPKLTWQYALKQSKRLGWWWYALFGGVLAWIVLDTDWGEGRIGLSGLWLNLSGTVAVVIWILFAVPYLEAGRPRFGRRDEEKLGGSLAPVTRCRSIVVPHWGMTVFFTLHYVLITPALVSAFADTSLSLPWWVSAPSLGSLLLLLWAFWATPRLEQRVRRTAWRVLVCYDCGEPLHGVTAANCPECDAALQRPTACPRCRYDVAHLASSACPECGQELLPPLDPAASPEQTRNSASAAASPIANTDA